MSEGQETKEQTIEQRVDDLEEGISTILNLLEDLTKTIDTKVVKRPAGKFGEHRERTAVKDTVTGKIYPSKARVGKELAGTEGFETDKSGKPMDPGNNFVYYQIMGKYPDRFVDLPKDSEEAKKAWAQEAAVKEKERQEAQAKLDAEEAAKKAEEEKPAPAQAQSNPAPQPAKGSGKK